jgi:nitrite reductase/ring-hydroxylating ferredoxin subunit
VEPQKFVPVARADEIAPGQTRVVEAGGRKIALANVDGTIHAVDNECPHFGGPMGLGKLNGSALSCPWHGWTFDVKTGENVHSPQLSLKCFEVKVEDGEVLVKV